MSKDQDDHVFPEDELEGEDLGNASESDWSDSYDDLDSSQWDEYYDQGMADDDEYDQDSDVEMGLDDDVLGQDPLEEEDEL